AASRKRRPPFLPTAVGLITGRASAAERDVVENARRRWPSVRIVTREVAVQGPLAAGQVIDALRELDADREVQVIVIARGGGSLEDLLPFSDEALLRAVAAARTPVVSAIGHEQDSPLLDFVADVRASTPTDAAKKVVPDVGEQAGLAASSSTGWSARPTPWRTCAAGRCSPLRCATWIGAPRRWTPWPGGPSAASRTPSTSPNAR